MSSKLTLIAGTSLFLTVISMPIRAYEQNIASYQPEPLILVQRNCDPGDLTINNERTDGGYRK